MRANISKNNFDLIRLLAASQVAVMHVNSYLSPSFNETALARFLDLFPGVPVFFFISGFLISRSYEKTPAITDYARNRSLRLFPALHACVALNIALVAATGYFASVGAGAKDILALYLAKTTFLQFYNPEFMRQFGDGVLNGSLWTICVEIQFYCLTPLIYWFAVSDNVRRTNLWLIGLVLCSIVGNRLLYGLAPAFGDEVLWKLARVSFVPWIYMFLCGVLLQRNFGLVSRFLSGRNFIIAAVGYVAFALLLHRHGARLDNGISPILFFPLIAVVVMAAYTRPALSQSLLRGNDISYGIYIHHQPVVNMFLFYATKGVAASALTLLLTLVLAVLSWFLIERPCLRRKRHSSHAVPASTPGN